MQLKRLREIQDNISWPENVEDLPVISWQSCTSRASFKMLLFPVMFPQLHVVY